MVLPSGCGTEPAVQHARLALSCSLDYVPTPFDDAVLTTFLHGNGDTELLVIRVQHLPCCSVALFYCCFCTQVCCVLVYNEVVSVC